MKIIFALDNAGSCHGIDFISELLVSSVYIDEGWNQGNQGNIFFWLNQYNFIMLLCFFASKMLLNKRSWCQLDYIHSYLITLIEIFHRWQMRLIRYYHVLNEPL